MSALPDASLELTVPFHDVDPLLVVWHGHYYKYLELARTALMKRCALDVPDLVALGYRMMVIETHCRHTRPLRYDERFRVTARFLDVDHRLMVGYEIQSVTHDRRVARARTSLVTTTPDGALLLETPHAIRSRIVA